MGILWKDGYSAHVEIYLIVGDEHLPVAQVGPNSLILRQPSELPAGHAQIVIKVDDHEEVHDVILGTTSGTEHVNFA